MKDPRHDLFPEVVKHVKPIIIHYARRISAVLSIPYDDAYQEVQFALYRALDGYDFNRSRGGLHAYTDTVLRNCASSMITGANTTARVPNVVCFEDGAQKVVKRARLASLDEMAEAGTPAGVPVARQDNPEEELLGTELAERRRKLVMRLVNGLNAREREIFKCLAGQSEAFEVYMRNLGIEKTTHTAIANFLGITKNGVDYDAHSIRESFTRLAESEFPDLVSGKLRSGAWPMIHVSRAEKVDHAFVVAKLQERKLDPRPLGRCDVDSKGDWEREVQHYAWGVVLILRNKKMFRTLVIEGEFNAISGGVAGADGTCKNLSKVVPWYPALVRELGRK